MKIYTRSGDLGETSLLGGERLSKASLRIATYGTVDELNANIGFLTDLLTVDDTLAELAVCLKREMSALFSLGSFLATPQDKLSEFNLAAPKAAQVDLLESEIDTWQKKLPKLTNFILPVGHASVSRAHIARTVARRAERKLVQLFNALPEEKQLEDAIKYVNRLSDWLFVLSRVIGARLSVEEVIWNGSNA